MSQDSPDANRPTHFGEVLRELLPCLDGCGDLDDPRNVRKVLQAMSVMFDLLKKLEQTLFSELEVLGKSHAPIKPMAEALAQQGLLDLEKTLQEDMRTDSDQAARVEQHAELLFRWYSAILAGVQAAVLQVPDEAGSALNPSDWQVEKKRWSSEESTYWNHFKFVIRQEFPLQLGDRLKSLRGGKTLEAYAILGQQSSQ